MMAPLGNLTKSGLLYEGSSFDQWEANLRIRLRAEGLEDVAWPKSFRRRCSEEQLKLAGDIIRLHVSPELRKRVQCAPHLCPTRLLSVLRQLAQPFRLLDLPAELRNRIYSYAIARGTMIEIAPLKKSITGSPSITTASRQLRAETLPILYPRCTLKIDLRSGKTSFSRCQEEAALDVEKAVRACVKRTSKAHLRHLREVYLTVPLVPSQTRAIQSWCSTSRTLRACFSPTQGLGMKITRSFSPGSPYRWYPAALTGVSLLENEIHKQVEKTERLRRVLDFQGESTFLALLSEETLWERRLWCTG